jgi:hypothetical protein
MSTTVEYDPEPLYAVEIPVISDKTRTRVIEYATHALSLHTDVIEEAISWHVHREVRELFSKTFPVTVDVTRFRV